ncbi:HIT family protein [Pararcticibacter amylolyticus]|uniref:HIT domain-containing protein n=1 Tax=Pararcticibacter amylolyticus TaxID=2173175 RepID=A0A2U2PD41_9SPHI|nr:hypothetical protein DDR33_17320 [Pararcticibacter amylolyticus]
MIKDLEEQIIRTCRFCDPPDNERILYQTDNFYVMLSLGPIVEGYCLVISKDHVSCCAGISKDQQNEFIELYDKVKSILTDVYGHCICYEHGRAGACLIPIEGSKHCYHAHMHFVPVSLDLNRIVELEYDPTRIQGFDNFFRIYDDCGRPPYLYIDDGESNFYVIKEQLRRQYLRYKTASFLGKRHLWNWIEHQGWEIIKSGFGVLSPHFRKKL